MSTWRDQILREFTPQVARLTLVADPDGLLLEEGILEGIRARGFELLPFEDRVAFRFAYESKFRSRWDQGEYTDLVVVLRLPESNLTTLPYDLLQAGRKLSFTLADIFPDLSYPVVMALDRGDLTALYEAQKSHAPGRLGDNATADFVLRYVFEIAPELIKHPPQLLRVLLRLHYRNQRLPVLFSQRLTALLRQNPSFDDWPLETLLNDREAFFAFVQERWPVFLNCEAMGHIGVVHDHGIPYVLTLGGPADLPFGDDEVRTYINTLFLEGQLQPVLHEQAHLLGKSWARVGLRSTSPADDTERVGQLIANLNEVMPAEDARHTEWFRFARGWAELMLLVHGQPEPMRADSRERIIQLQARVDAGFTAWILRRYAGLINLPPSPPVMLHHLPRYLARQVCDDRRAKVALIVMDGLALDQWLVLRNALALRQPWLRFREQSVFAWIPSLTSVSRQAAFAGRPPIFFPDSIQTTDKEAALWTQFWADQGLAPYEILYRRGLGAGSLEEVFEAFSHPKLRVVGLVVDMVDKIMHGMELGTAGMHNQVCLWAGKPYLGTLLNSLLDHGFRIYLTSDHGNIEATGCGIPKEGALADLRGQRVRVFPDAALRERVRLDFPDAIAWQTTGLPKDYLALLAPSRQAFAAEAKHLVCHGGIALEELIVPLVQIERKS